MARGWHYTKLSLSSDLLPSLFFWHVLYVIVPFFGVFFCRVFVIIIYYFSCCLITRYIFYLGTCTFVHGSLLYMHICVTATTTVCV